MSAFDLAIEFLNGRETAWITRKQKDWLERLILRDRRLNRTRGYTIHSADAMSLVDMHVSLNGAAILKLRHVPTQAECDRANAERAAKAAYEQICLDLSRDALPYLQNGDTVGLAEIYESYRPRLEEAFAVLQEHDSQ